MGFFGLIGLSLALHSMGADVYGTDPLPPLLWERLAVRDVLARATALQLVFIALTALILFAVMARVWRSPTATPVASDEATATDARPDAPTTIPDGPSPDHAVPSLANPAGH